MNSLDSENNAPESVLTQFEDLLTKNLKNLREKKENVSKQDSKKFIRFFCKKNAAILGLNEEKALQVAQYFFKFTYEDPQTAAKTWELLHSLSENSTNQEAANQIFSELLQTNKDGLTLLWRVVRGIIHGNFSVEATNIDGQNIYHLVTPGNSDERQKDKNRHNISNSLKDQIENDITHKPLPDVGNDAVRMTPQDRDLFFKIFRFMQSDTDALITSNAWQSAISEYLSGIAKHLLSTIKILDVQGRSDARKKRYRKFILHVLDGYLKSLIEYCKIMVGKQSERNPFASDLLFEHYLLSNNLFVDDVKEPSHRVIEGKWSKLFKEMKIYIEDNATMYGIRAIGTPEIQRTTNGEIDHFPTQVTDEIPPPPPPEPITTIRKNTKDAIDPVGKTIMMGASAPVPPTDNWNDVWATAESKNPEMGKTGAVAAILREEIGKFEKNPQGLPPAVRLKKRLPSSFSYPCVIVAPGTEAEMDLIKLVRNDISVIFSEQADELKSQPSKSFVEKLTQIAKNRVCTHALMIEFISRILVHYEDLSRKLNPHETNNVFDNISTTFNTIGENLSIPTRIVKSLGKQQGSPLNNSPIPMSSNLGQIIEGIPSIDSKDFENLKAFLLRKKLHTRFQEIKDELSDKMVKVDIKELESLTELNRRLALAFSPEEGFIYYYKEKEALIDAALKDVGKLAGNWFTKHFKFGRSKQVKEEMQKYLGQLEDSINATWSQALEPTLNQYGKIIFGSDLYLYTQKT